MMDSKEKADLIKTVFSTTAGQLLLQDLMDDYVLLPAPIGSDHNLYRYLGVNELVLEFYKTTMEQQK